MKPDNRNISLQAMKLDDSALNMSNKIVMDSEIDVISTINRKGDNSNTKDHALMRIIKEIINIPFITGIGAIIISAIPYVGSYLGDKSTIGFKLFIGTK